MLIRAGFGWAGLDWAGLGWFVRYRHCCRIRGLEWAGPNFTLVRMWSRWTNTGRRSAQGRLANLLVELWERQRRNGMTDTNILELPISQTVLADAIGLTPVHVSRVMSQLAEANVISFDKRSRKIVALDRTRLYQLAGVSDHMEYVL